MTAFFVFIGGGLGALTRYGLGNLFPFQILSIQISTLLANIIGSSIAGFFLAILIKSPNNTQLKAIALIGFCGGLTTFSSYIIELLPLFEKAAWKSIFLQLILHHSIAFVLCYLTFYKASQYLGS